MRCQCNMQAYRDEKGNEVFISHAIGKGSWGVFRLHQVRGCLATHPVTASTLPMVECKAQAQRNLDLFAGRRKGWKPVRTCRVCGCTDRRANQGGWSWVSKDLCSWCAGEMQERERATQRRETGLEKHLRYLCEDNRSID